MKGQLVSIIMPCHNGEKTIRDAIASVQNQTCENWELLVIDDDSSDASAEIVSNLASSDSRIRLLHVEKSTGLPATPRNVGIKAASGRYIAFLDCDDEWLPSKLEHQLPLFSVRNVAVVFSWYGKMSAEGSFHPEKINSPLFVSYAGLLTGNCIGNLTGIYDTEKVGKVFQKEIHHEDYLMWLEILRKGFFAMNTNTVEAVYRESDRAVSRNKMKVFRWTWNIYRHELNLPFLTAAGSFFRYACKALLKFLK